MLIPHVRRPSCLLLAALMTHALYPGLTSRLAADDSVSFSRDIQPLLGEHCIVCHGPDVSEAGLRLDNAERAHARLESGTRAIVPGQPDASELLRRVSSTDAAIRMPPEGDPLTAQQIESLQKWIAEGARYEEHWAWQPVVEPSLPQVNDQTWIRGSLDRFVLARLEQENIAPSPEADRATLIQRLSYDLIGLPPEPEEVDAFVNDKSASAYENLVDRLLDSPHFGERWGRHWLDKARYADSDGYEKDNPRPNAWRYRDWVINAINQDMPYDQFTIEQLAGDLLPQATPMQKLATAFHRQTLTNTEGGADQEQFRVEANFDRTETTSAVWMALTMTCARCHHHKYDEISQQEYYQLFAFFNDADDGDAEVPISESEFEKYQAAIQIHDSKVADVSAQLNDAIARLQPEIDHWIADLDTQQSQNPNPLEIHPATIVRTDTESGSILTLQADGSLLVSGRTPEVDQYRLVMQLPPKPLTGVRVELLPDESLPAKGPGRASNGNLVLTNLRARIGRDANLEQATDVEFVAVETDFSQDKFPAAAVLATDHKSGWAISPQVGQPHWLSATTKHSIAADAATFIELVLDQQHGKQHTIGRFRVTLVSGVDPLKAFPEPIAVVMRKSPADRSPDDLRVIAEHVATQHEPAAKLLGELAELKQNAPKKPVMKVPIINPAERQTAVLQRGDFLQPADVVTAGALAIVHRHHPLLSRRADTEADRLDLARWLVDPAHPLTSRVTVNQVWAQLFGKGMVPTLNDFGVRGEPPTHPALLDWLAWQFSHSMNWSRKQLIKTIVISATWRQASVYREELQTIDPTNRLLARQNRIRVEAEIVRDMNLAVGGLLDRTIGGPSVYPPLPPGVAELSYANNFKWETSTGNAAYRRGMYTFFKRTSPHPTLVSFDCPDSNTTRLQREISNTPLQALVTLNNEVYAESAQALARRVLEREEGNDRSRLADAIRRCITRPPDDAEIDRFLELLEESRLYYRAHPDDAKAVIERHPAANVAADENAAWVVTVRMILNLDEFIVRD